VIRQQALRGRSATERNFIRGSFESKGQKTRGASAAIPLRSDAEHGMRNKKYGKWGKKGSSSAFQASGRKKILLKQADELYDDSQKGNSEPKSEA